MGDAPAAGRAAQGRYCPAKGEAVKESGESMPLPGGELWERRPKETAKAYAAFKAYCNMGTSRSIRALVQKHGKCRALLENWSRRHGWQERVMAWDAEQDRQRREAESQALRAEAAKWAKRQQELRESEWQAGEELQAKAKAMLTTPLSKRIVKDGGKTLHIYPINFSFGTAARMIEVASKLMRLAAGIATETVNPSAASAIAVPVGRVVIVPAPADERTGASD